LSKKQQMSAPSQVKAALAESKAIELKVQVLDELCEPDYATQGASGFDLVAREDFRIEHGQIRVIWTGIKVEVPKGYELQIRPRSSVAKQGLLIPNSPGTVDSDYRGEVGVIVLYQGAEDAYNIKRGDRIAQAVLCEVTQAKIVKVEALSETVRGAGGFGSTGT